MIRDFDLAKLRSLLAESERTGLQAFFNAIHPTLGAENLDALHQGEAARILPLLDPEKGAEVFAHLEPGRQVELAALLKRRDLAALVTAMSPDDRVDLLKRIPEEERETILPGLAQAERNDILKLSSYPEGTAGAIMTSEYAALSPGMTAREALDTLRLAAPDKETIYYAYVLDPERRLSGFVSLKDLILARPESRVGQFMHKDVILAQVDEDQESAVRKIAKYDLLALPVVDANRCLVGIITHDDAIDVLHQEHTEDMEKLMAIGGRHEAGAYLRTSSWRHFTNRATWIVGLAALGLVSGMIIHGFEDTLMSLLILALYMPMVADTGGNTGSQSATVVVRALALGEISPRDVLPVLWKELKISILLALVLGVLSYGKVLFLSAGSELPPGFNLGAIGLAIALALSLQVVTATLIGAVLPLAAARLGKDPAVIASPALTTIVDITGLLLYFGTAKMILGI
ncbi:MAG TPA: magnesium transporter [Desulfovibrio sp.]|uniref:magnesium transporter n=1 Tax=Desulfovibrio sp. TaxID=885 RepID=UPI002C7D4441|nr:magnesium transporter [Desulfovibrio sp.]HMM39283.1 magnesium transporter [Desulfovibrio sp.]